MSSPVSGCAVSGNIELHVVDILEVDSNHNRDE